MNKKIVCVFLLSIILMGCSSKPVKLQLDSANRLNMNEYNKSLPVILKVYQLSDPAPLKEASFSELWKQDDDVLGGSLISKQEYTVLPNSSLEISIPKDKKTSHIGLFASFRKPDGDSWRVIKPAKSGFFAKKMAVKIVENKIIAS